MKSYMITKEVLKSECYKKERISFAFTILKAINSMLIETKSKYAYFLFIALNKPIIFIK